MNFDNVVFETGTAGFLSSLVALQVASGIDHETAVARVEATLHSGSVLLKSNSWYELRDLWQWFATPPEGQTIPSS